MFDSVVWLSGMPRSGTTWLGQILASHPDIRLKHCPLFSYEFRDRCNESSDRSDWLNLLHEVYHQSGPFLDQEHLRSKGLVPQFQNKAVAPRVLAIKSNRFHHLSRNIIELVPEVRWIAVVRHPAATIHSWITNATEFPANADPATEWRTGACRKSGPGEFWGFNDWLTVTKSQLALSREFPDRVHLLRYDSFDLQPMVSTLKLFTWLGLDVDPQVEDFVAKSQALHSDNKRSVFKKPGNSSRWQRELDENIRHEIEETCVRENLADFLHIPTTGVEG